MSFTPSPASALELLLGYVGTGDMVAGSHNLAVGFSPLPWQISGTPFSAGDVGRTIAVIGAGANAPITPAFGPLGKMLVTTVASFVDGAHVTLTAAAGNNTQSGASNTILFRPFPTRLDSINLDGDITTPGRKTLSFNIVNKTGGMLVCEGMPILLRHPVLGDLFGGTVDSVDITNDAGSEGSTWFSVQCVGYAAILDRRIVNPYVNDGGVFTGAAGSCVVDLIWNYTDSEGMDTSVATGPSIVLPSEGLNTGTQAMDDIVQAANAKGTDKYFWFVDPWRVVHFQLTTALTAPWNIADDDGTDSNILSLLTYNRSRDKLANYVFDSESFIIDDVATSEHFTVSGIQTSFSTSQPIGALISVTLSGGSPESVGITGQPGVLWWYTPGSNTVTAAPITETFHGNSSTRDFFTGRSIVAGFTVGGVYPLASPIVKVNGVAKTVSEDGHPGFQFYVSFAGHLSKLEQDTSETVLTSGDTLEITYQPALTVSGQSLDISYRPKVEHNYFKTNDASIATRSAIESGTGIWGTSISASDPINNVDADAAIQAKADAFAHPPVSFSYVTLRSGLEAGQVQHIKMISRGIEGNFIIDKITMTTQTGWIKWTVHVVNGSVIGDWKSAFGGLQSESISLGATTIPQALSGPSPALQVTAVVASVIAVAVDPNTGVPSINVQAVITPPGSWDADNIQIWIVVGSSPPTDVFACKVSAIVSNTVAFWVARPAASETAYLCVIAWKDGFYYILDLATATPGMKSNTFTLLAQGLCLATDITDAALGTEGYPEDDQNNIYCNLPYTATNPTQADDIDFFFTTITIQKCNAAGTPASDREGDERVIHQYFGYGASIDDSIDITIPPAKNPDGSTNTFRTYFLRAYCANDLGDTTLQTTAWSGADHITFVPVAQDWSLDLRRARLSSVGYGLSKTDAGLVASVVGDQLVPNGDFEDPAGAAHGSLIIARWTNQYNTAYIETTLAPASGSQSVTFPGSSPDIVLISELFPVKRGQYYSLKLYAYARSSPDANLDVIVTFLDKNGSAVSGGPVYSLSPGSFSAGFTLLDEAFPIPTTGTPVVSLIIVLGCASGFGNSLHTGAWTIDRVEVWRVSSATEVALGDGVQNIGGAVTAKPGAGLTLSGGAVVLNAGSTVTTIAGAVEVRSNSLNTSFFAAHGISDLSKYSLDNRPVSIVFGLPLVTDPNYLVGSMVFNSGDGKLYRKMPGDAPHGFVAFWKDLASPDDIIAGTIASSVTVAGRVFANKIEEAGGGISGTAITLNRFGITTQISSLFQGGRNVGLAVQENSTANISTFSHDGMFIYNGAGQQLGFIGRVGSTSVQVHLYDTPGGIAGIDLDPTVSGGRVTTKIVLCSPTTRPSLAFAGYVIFNSGTGHLEYYNGSTWVSL